MRKKQVDPEIENLLDETADINAAIRELESQLDVKKKLLMKAFSVNKLSNVETKRWNGLFVKSCRSYLNPKILVEAGVSAAIITKATKKTPSAFIKFTRRKD